MVFKSLRFVRILASVRPDEKSLQVRLMRRDGSVGVSHAPPRPLFRCCAPRSNLKNKKVARCAIVYKRNTRRMKAALWSAKVVLPRIGCAIGTNAVPHNFKGQLLGCLPCNLIGRQNHKVGCPCEFCCCCVYNIGQRVSKLVPAIGVITCGQRPVDRSGCKLNKPSQLYRRSRRYGQGQGKDSTDASTGTVFVRPVSKYIG